MKVLNTLIISACLSLPACADEQSTAALIRSAGGICITDVPCTTITSETHLVSENQPLPTEATVTIEKVESPSVEGSYFWQDNKYFHQTSGKLEEIGSMEHPIKLQDTKSPECKPATAFGGDSYSIAPPSSPAKKRFSLKKLLVRMFFPFRIHL